MQQLHDPPVERVPDDPVLATEAATDAPSGSAALTAEDLAYRYENFSLFDPKWLDVDLEHDCESTDYESGDYPRLEHRRRGEPNCGYGRGSARLYNKSLQDQRAQEDAKEKAIESGKESPTTVDLYTIYWFKFYLPNKRKMHYIGYTNDWERRRNEHTRRVGKGDTKQMNRLLEAGVHHSSHVLQEGIEGERRAQGAEQFAIKCLKFGRLEDCLNGNLVPSHIRTQVKADIDALIDSGQIGVKSGQ